MRSIKTLTVIGGIAVTAIARGQDPGIATPTPPVDAGASNPGNGTQSTPWVRKPDAGNFFLFMNKSKNELSVRDFATGEVIKIYRAISGTNSGDKEREGDKKTPEGIYFVERRIPRSLMTALHGAAAFELNYPNPIDRIFKRTGDGIWIHGVDRDNRMKKSFDTLGCVAVSNDDVRDIAEVLTFKDIPIVIFDHGDAQTRLGLEADGGPLHRRVNDWAKAWSSMDAEAYLAFYNQDFYSRRMNYAQWRAYKTNLTKYYKRIHVTLDDLKILQHGKYSVAIFRQTYESDKIKSVARKRLYLVGDGATASILAEEAIDDVVETVIAPPAPAIGASPDQPSADAAGSASAAPAATSTSL